jgi:hypothetical protein
MQHRFALAALPDQREPKPLRAVTALNSSMTSYTRNRREATSVDESVAG